MPFSIHPVPDVYNCISRPVNAAVVQQFMRVCNIPQAEVRFPGYVENVAVTQSTLKHYHDAPRLPSDARIEISVDEVIADDSFTNTPVLYKDQPFYVLDPNTQIGLKPGYSRVRSTISVKYVAPDQLTATRWRNTVRQLALRGLTLFNSTVTYQYNVPPAVVSMLMEFHAQMENLAGYGQTFIEWLRKNAQPNTGFNVNLNGAEMALVVRETQNNIWGSPEFMFDPPKPEKSNDAGAYSVDFSFTFQYQRCDWCVAHYPLMVHNQLINPAYLAHRIGEPFPELIPSRLSNTMEMVRFMNEFNKHNHPDIDITGIPTHQCDDWLCPTRRNNMKNVLRVLLCVDPANPTAVINLNDMGEFTFSTEALNYLAKRPKSCTVAYDNVFYIRLFKWDDPLPQSALQVTTGLAISTQTPLNLRHVYRLVVDMVTDPSLLSEAAMEDLYSISGFLDEYKKALSVLSPTSPYLSDTNSSTGTQSNNSKHLFDPDPYIQSLGSVTFDILGSR